MTTRKQDYEHAHSAGEAAAEGWFDDAADTREESDARDAAWRSFRGSWSFLQTTNDALSADGKRMRLAFVDGWNDFSDRYDVASGYAELGHRSED